MYKIFNKVFSDKFIILGVLLFSVFFLPYIKTIPYLDGNIDFVKSHDFFEGGFTELFKNWSSVHPPLKEFLIYLSFRMFGVSAWSYNLLGYIFGTFGIIFYYLLAKNLFDKNIARIAVLLLSMSPLFLSVGVFFLTDYILTILFIISLYFYSKNKLLFYSITASLSYLAKETGLVLAVSVLLIELVFIKRNFSKKKFINILIICIPFLVNLIWIYYIKSNNKALWSDWNFAETADRGTLFTIFNNLITFNFLNPYAYQNWRQLFILNFNWLYWLIFVSGIVIVSKSKKQGYLNLFQSIILNKTGLAIILTFAGYFIAVLSFQTYTITRYGLPLIPILYLGTSWSLWIISKKYKVSQVYIYGILCIFVLITLFSSLDPISKSIWGSTKIINQGFYGVNRSLDGNDGITYNLQYLKVAKQRSVYLTNPPDHEVSPDDCYWLIADPNNDFKTWNILGIDPYPITSKCQK